MNDINDDLSKNISSWIQTQGYLFEINVANAFQKKGFSTSVSAWYSDYETKELREIDVIAETISPFKKNSRLCRISWHISCKTSHDKPWVVFLSDRVAPYLSLTSIASLSLKEYMLNKTDSAHWDFVFKDEPLLIPKKLGHGVTQALGGKTDLAFQAMMSAIKSCAYNAQQLEYIIDSKSKKKLATFWSIAIPVVVIDTHLFECYIDPQDNSEHLTEVSESCVIGRKIQFDKYIAWPIVHIVTASALESFVQRSAIATQKIIETFAN